MTRPKELKGARRCEEGIEFSNGRVLPLDEGRALSLDMDGLVADLPSSRIGSVRLLTGYDNVVEFEPSQEEREELADLMAAEWHEWAKARP